jgi:hypothetical protein
VDVSIFNEKACAAALPWALKEQLHLPVFPRSTFGKDMGFARNQDDVCGAMADRTKIRNSVKLDPPLA